MKWSDDATKEMENVPRFVRGMAKKAVEKEVAKDGRNEITIQDVCSAYEKYIKFAEKEPKETEKTVKIAVVRCEIVSEVCPGIACLQAFNKRKIAFSEYGEKTEIIGFFTCGDCPGRRIFRLVERLLKYGLDVVHLSSCMIMDDDYPKCPHREQIKTMLEQKGIKVVEGTHH